PSSNILSDASSGRSPSSRSLTIRSRRPIASSKPGALVPFLPRVIVDLLDVACQAAVVQPHLHALAGPHHRGLLQDGAARGEPADRVAPRQNAERGECREPLAVAGDGI